jgi:hypothetical protein
MIQAVRSLGPLIVALAVSGCAAHSGAAERAAGPAPPAAVAPAALTGPTPNQKLEAEVTEALLRADHKVAAAVIERARRAAAPQPSAQLLAYFDATVHAYQGDFRGAAQVMYDHVAKVGPAAEAAFSFHDSMIALRTADGDLLGALVECEEMVKAGTLGTWKPDNRMLWVRLKEHWHRAYLLRMIAQTLTGAEREAFLGYAERARRDYAAVATPLGNAGDSIAVLDAYFAFCDGDRAKMRQAAQRVNVAADDDLEDLYLVQLALDGAGDREAAAAVRKRMRAIPSVTVLTPVFLSWLRTDEAADQPPAFSPKHPSGTRPAR